MAKVGQNQGGMPLLIRTIVLLPSFIRNSKAESRGFPRLSTKYYMILRQKPGIPRLCKNYIEKYITF